jgi:hypothetical protein
MKCIEHRGKTVDETYPNDPIPFEFEALRHYIGRLGHHIRAVTQVIEDSKGLRRLFDEYTVSQVPVLSSVFDTEADSKNTLEGILNRMSNTAGYPCQGFPNRSSHIRQSSGIAAVSRLASRSEDRRKSGEANKG